MAAHVDALAEVDRSIGLLDQAHRGHGMRSRSTNGGGSYALDPLDMTSADNGCTVIVADDGGRWKLEHNGQVSGFQGGMKFDNATDDYAALMNLLTASNSGVKEILLPCGHAYISGTINLCNLAATGFSMSIRGASILRDDGGATAGTYLRCEPGAGKNVLEQIGSQFITWSDVKFVSEGANGASNGIVIARSTAANYAQNNAFYRCMVLMDRPGAYTFYNNCGEQMILEGNWFEGPRPYIAALAAEGAPPTQFAAIANTIFSNTVHSIRGNTFLATEGPAVWLVGVGTADWSANTLKKKPGNVYPYGLLLQSSGSGYQDNYNFRFHGQIEDFQNAVRLEGQTFGVHLDLSLSNIQSAPISLGPSSVHYNPQWNITQFNTTGTFNAITAPGGANIFGGHFVIPPNSIQIDTSLGLRGTDVDATNHDTSNPAVFSVAAGSSFTVRGAATNIYAKAAWTPGNVASPGNSVPLDVAVPGAAVGDHVEVTFPYAAQGCTVSGSVDVAGQVRLIIQNITGATVNFAAGTFKIRISRQPNAN